MSRRLSFAVSAILAGAAIPSFPAASATLRPVVRSAARHDLSPPLRIMRPVAPRSSAIEMPRPGPLPGRGVGTGSAAPAAEPLGSLAGGAMPGPTGSFEGIDNVDGVVPPDTVGAVGPRHVVEWVNKSYAVFDRQGSLLLGPLAGTTIWSGLGGVCETSNGGDPIVLYDKPADRWLLSQLAFTWPTNFHQCIAVSQTGDPTGAWFRYDFFFDATKLNDYPKFAVWPDAYYLAVNQYDGASQAYLGQGVLAFERGAMLAGGNARSVTFDLDGVDPRFGGQLPSDLDGPLPPPPGSPNYFVEVDDDAWGWPTDRLSIWKFHVDWSDPAASTFGSAGLPDAVIDLAAAGHGFDSDLCGYGPCVPQPGGGLLDTLSDRLMYRLAYRNFGDREVLTVDHTVDVDGTDHAGVRWYEIDDPGGTPLLAQAGTFAPDADHRWMASTAMDANGDLAIGYSVSGLLTSPSIRYAGRLASDPPGALPQAEATLVAGTGYQAGAARWGDYSALVVDPTDDCTFWYFGEYYATAGAFPWQTRFGSFRFDGCRACPLVGRPACRVDRDGAGILISWSAAPNASAYDLVEGSLATLRATAGSYAASTTACLAHDLAAASLHRDEPDPPPGEGIWYLVRAARDACRATYDEGAPSQIGGRDDGILGSAVACP